jgi:formate-dependent nitrite reductase membrane component NrfD
VTARPDIGATRATRGDRTATHARPVIKPPVWTWEIPVYFWAGGLGGASAALAYGARLAGNMELERRAWAVALAGLGASPPLLVSDLGRPARFINMLRVLKPTSPMSVGSWVLGGCSTATGVATFNAFSGRLDSAAALARPVAAGLGLPLSTYTAALIANTAVPAWHEARHDLPFVFGASAAATAGAVTAIATPGADGRAARTLAAGGALAEVAAAAAMERRLGPLGEAYRSGAAGVYGRIGKALGIAGAALLAIRGERSRAATATGGALIAVGALALRWSVFKAGIRSAQDPDQTVVPQRERIERGETRGAARRGGERRRRVGARVSGSPALGA